MIYKRERKAARDFAAFAFMCSAVLCLAGEFEPACLVAMAMFDSSKKAIAKELSWRKYWNRTGFEWAAWSHGKSHSLLGMSKQRVDLLTQVRVPSHPPSCMGMHTLNAWQFFVMPALLQRPDCIRMLGGFVAWKTRTNGCVVCPPPFVVMCMCMQMVSVLCMAVCCGGDHGHRPSSIPQHSQVVPCRRFSWRSSGELL